MSENEIRVILADKLREFRQRAGLTAKEVGDLIGKSYKTVSGWEHGRGQPDADMLFRLCEIYNVGNISEFYETSRPQPDTGLSQDEAELVALYRALNDNAKAALLTTARGFAGNPAMTQEDVSGEAM